MMKLSFAINNGGKMVLSQIDHDGNIFCETYYNDKQENTFTISAGDFITMLNWCRYQKEKGNINLYFE